MDTWAFLALITMITNHFPQRLLWTQGEIILHVSHFINFTYVTQVFNFSLLTLSVIEVRLSNMKRLSDEIRKALGKIFGSFLLLFLLEIAKAFIRGLTWKGIEVSQGTSWDMGNGFWYKVNLNNRQEKIVHLHRDNNNLRICLLRGEGGSKTLETFK